MRDLNRPLRQSSINRFLSNFSTPADGCWEWTASTRFGYGQVNIGFEDESRGVFRAHRVSYRLFYGSVPNDLELHHKCENRKRVRPDHLIPLTTEEHRLLTPLSPSSINKAKTHCKYGHEFTEANTLIFASARKARYCRTCRLVLNGSLKALRAKRRLDSAGGRGVTLGDFKRAVLECRSFNHLDRLIDELVENAKRRA